MADIFNYAIFHWKDSNGKTAVSFLVTQDQTSGGASTYEPLAAAMQDACDAAIVAVQFCQTLVLATTPTSGAYGTVWDRGALIGRNSVTYASQRSVLVGPKEDIFLPDRNEINLTDPRIIAVQTEVQALLGDSMGNPFGPFQRGVRQKASGS
jgi:hypothetical protein